MFIKKLVLFFLFCFSSHSFGSAEPHTSHAPQSSENKTTEHKPHWEYSGEHGPAHWADLDPAFQVCERGKNQSPINLKWKKPRETRDIEFHYTASPLKIIDNGHTIQVNFEKGSYAHISGKKFDLLQVHFHSASEHTLSGKSFPLEAHFVHKSEDGQLGVIGIFLTEGKENKFLKQVFSNIPKEKEKEVTYNNESIFAFDLFPPQKTHYHYMGSLTTPPCSENVNWNVLNTPVEASVEQLSFFRKLYSGNNRPIQEVNQRKPANYE